MSEKNSKRKIILTIAIILAITMLAGVVYARYVLHFKRTAAGDVARWQFEVNDSENEVDNTALSVKTYNNTTIAAQKIAPGTEGKFEIKINAQNVDTAFNYSVEFENVTNKPNNLYFTIGESTEPIYSMETLETQLSNKRMNPNSQDSYEIKWVWPFTGGNDVDDTTFGKAGSPFSFDMHLNIDQVEPTV